MILTSASRSGGEVRITEAERPRARPPRQEGVPDRNRHVQRLYRRALHYVAGIWHVFRASRA
jgi:hypothetical protein